MTKDQFKERVQELIIENDRMINEKVDKILSSGCVDLDDYENDFRLPKCFMYAIGKEMQYQWRSHDKALMGEAENIALFM